VVVVVMVVVLMMVVKVNMFTQMQDEGFYLNLVPKYVKSS
jgi:hypothetical protein